MAEVTFEYEPRNQFLPFHKRKERFACIVAHRRGGKTVACINEALTRAAYTGKKDARYAYVAPYYRQAKDVAWSYLKSYGAGVITKIRESELRVELFNGAWITLYGADNPDALRGIYLDGVVLDEYGDSRPSLWEQVIYPTLLDRTGWAVFIGTPKGKNHFYSIYKKSKELDTWYSMTMRASESGILKPEDLAQMREQTEEATYLQEMECDFLAAVKGAYYSHIVHEMEARGAIAETMAVYDPKKKVKVATDIGRKDSTAAWFWQDTINGPAIIDYEEETGKDVDFFVDLFNAKGYDYEEIWVPHDAVAKTFATKRSTIEQFQDADLPMMLCPKLAVQHGIDAARKIMPMCTFNSVKCYDGVEALRAYKKKYNELTKSFSDTPQHDWASDGADAFRYLCLVCQETPEVKEVAKKHVPLVKPPEYRLNDLFEDNEKGKKRFETLRLH